MNSLRLAFLLIACAVLVLTPTTANAQDNWNGGSGNWSVSTQWSTGSVPRSTDAVFINTNSDLVYLDTSPSIASLTLGIPNIRVVSELTDTKMGVSQAQTLTIAGALTLDLSGYLYLAGGSTVTVGADSTSKGDISLYNGSKLSITGKLTNGGYVNLHNSSASMGALDNSSTVYLQSNSHLDVSGDVYNNGIIDTGFGGQGGNVLNIGGNLTNDIFGIFRVRGPNDQVKISGYVTNAGTVSNNSQWINIGTFSNDGTYDNTANLNNNKGAIFYTNGFYLGLYGVVNNSGTFTNAGEMTGRIDQFNNLSGGTLNNTATGRIQTEYLLTNPAGAAFNNDGMFYSESGLLNHGNVWNNGTIASDHGIYNDGNIYNYGSYVGNGGLGNDGYVENHGSIFIHESATLVNNGMLFTFGGTLTNDGQLTNNGNVSNQEGGTLTNFGTFDNNGTLYSEYLVANSGKLTNAGRIFNDAGTLDNSGTFTNQGNVFNYGSLNNAGALDNMLYLENDRSLTNSGAFTNEATLHNSDGTLNNQAGATLNNFGAVVNDYGTINNSGVLSSYGVGINNVGTINNNAPGFLEIGTVLANAAFINNGGLLLSHTIAEITSELGPYGIHPVVNNTGRIANYGTFTNGFYSTLNNSGAFDNLGYLTNDVGGTLNNTGSLENIASLLTNRGRFDNSGQLDISDGGQLNNEAGGTIYNSGTVNIAKGGSIYSDGNYLQSGGMTVVDGTLTGRVGIYAGRLMGTGTVFGVVDSYYGTMAPGDSVGTFTISYLYSQSEEGIFEEEIFPSGFDQLKVGGLVELDGTLVILLAEGYNPAVGTTYKFILCPPGGVFGAFVNIQNDIFNSGTEKWIVNYDNTNGYVELEAYATPEPSSLLLLGSGLLSLGYGVRHMKK